MTTVGFLHTAEVHVATFRGLFAELAPPGLADLHLVDEALLADARRTGSAPGLAGRLRELAAAGADLIVCTCSTIGADAEATPAGVPVVRLDRPMAEAAVAMGDRIAVVATVESTVEPTMALIRATAERLATPIPATAEQAVTPIPATAEQAVTPIPATAEQAVTPTPATTEQPATPIPATAEQPATQIPAAAGRAVTLIPATAGRALTLIPSPCLTAWRHFEAGDLAAYDAEIAAHIRAIAADADVFVLAQASMAGAAALLPDLPVLTSPRAAVEAAVRHAAALKTSV